MNHGNGEVRGSWRHSYSLGAITGFLLFMGIVLVMGGPYWPPFVLLFMGGAGLVSGSLPSRTFGGGGWRRGRERTRRSHDRGGGGGWSDRQAGLDSLVQLADRRRGAKCMAS